ncbi:MAG TPA: MarR family transcriptional regulator [Lapillicoccus sp.]|nr:MarR family transcriptional regulator [Lapillicoccus sp.]
MPTDTMGTQAAAQPEGADPPGASVQPEAAAPPEASVQPETAQALSNTLVRVMKIMSAMKHQAPRQHPAVDPSHYPVLFCLSGDPQRVSAVAESIHSDVSTVSRQVTHLVHHGLLDKIGDPDDRRAQLLSLSPSGREVIDKLVRGRGQWFGQLLASWTDDDVRAFDAYLTRFGDDLEAFKARVSTSIPTGNAAHQTSTPSETIPEEPAHER